jgi:hypothetical protein
LGSSADEVIHETCRADGRTLITLDLDFANPLGFPLEPTEGLVVVRPPRPLLPAIRATLVSMPDELKSRPITGMLWIVEPGRIRVYDPPGDPRTPPD